MFEATILQLLSKFSFLGSCCKGWRPRKESGSTPLKRKSRQCVKEATVFAQTSPSLPVLVVGSLFVHFTGQLQDVKWEIVKQ